MGILTIEFGGICVHMTQMQPYRIIIPAGTSAGSDTILTPTIKMPGGITLPCLPLVADTNDTFTPQGVTFTIGSTTGAGPSFDLQCTPNLSEFPATPPLDQNVVSGQQAPAAAYFDFWTGSISLDPGRGQIGVAYAVATVDFSGDEATISVQCWNGGSPQQITIPLPASIVVNNAPPGSSNLDSGEFLTSFLIVDPMGTDATIQHLSEIPGTLSSMVACLQSKFGPPPPQTLRAGDFDTVPSCSNSQWP